MSVMDSVLKKISALGFFDEYVKKQPHWMSLNITEDEKRKALVFMKEHVDKNTGFNWKSLEQALTAVVEKRKC